MTAKKIKPNAVTSSKIRRGSVRAADLASDALGKKVTVEYVASAGSVLPEGLGSAFVECPEGTILVSVGVENAENHLRLVYQGTQTESTGEVVYSNSSTTRQGVFRAIGTCLGNAERGDR